MRRVHARGILLAALLSLACAACGAPTDGSDGVPGATSASPVARALHTAPPAVAPTPSSALTDGVVPRRLRIAAVGIDVAVVPVGETSTGDLAVPVAWQDAGWFSPGFRPGQRGHAVIVGHLDTDDRNHPLAAFSDLSHVAPGTAVEVSGDGGAVLHFVVRSAHVYPADAVPLHQVFAADTTPTLELLTCAGVWRGHDLGYSERLVLTAQESLS